MATLLDWGATCSTITEEVACLLIDYVLTKVGRMKMEDPLSPIILYQLWAWETSLAWTPSMLSCCGRNSSLQNAVPCARLPDAMVQSSP